MIILGLTGSIGMGKTTAANMLRATKGVAVHCADETVRALYDKPAVKGLIRTTFPESYDRKHNRIDKNALLESLDYDHEKWDALEDILHPFVREAQQKWLRLQHISGTKLAVLDIPLLFETGAQDRVNFTVVVTAPSWIQRRRLLQGRGMSEEGLAFRLARQMPDAEKRAQADFVIHSGLGLARTRRELADMIRVLTSREDIA